MKINELPTPCYLVDRSKLEANLKILEGVSRRTGAKVLLAQKAFSMFYFYPLIKKYLAGAASSGLYEARLAAEEMGAEAENHIFSPAYLPGQFDEILKCCSHIVFNSLPQLEKYRSAALAAGREIGLRINPEHSTQTGHAVYDPCAPFSRLGITASAFDINKTEGVTGLHFHTLCEQDSDALEETLGAAEKKFAVFFEKVGWINFGGGHHITRPGYDIARLERCVTRIKEKYGAEVYLEPGEAIALNAGYLITAVLDTLNNGMGIAVLDASAACHMPDVLEMPYRPPLLGSGKSGEKAYTYRLTGPTCLAGDIIGDYSFDRPLREDVRLVFCDMAIYTMVKNNTFNGMPLPAIAVTDGYDGGNGDCEVIRGFGYEDFKSRLS